MKFSKFGQKFTRKTGILQLMDDLGNALAGSEPVLMLGGGNPARLPEVNAAYERVMRGLLDSQAAIESVGNYSTPQGDASLIDALADFLRQEYGWHITRDNIALTNGSQNAFFYLFNLFGGAFEGGDKKILLPLAPEYVGYADAHIDGQHFLSVPPKMEDVQHEGQDGFFKYRVDFETLEHLPEWDTGEIGAICCSRPTNPTGNVLTDEDMARLDFVLQPVQNRAAGRADRYYCGGGRSGARHQQHERRHQSGTDTLRRGDCHPHAARRQLEAIVATRHPPVLPQAGCFCRQLPETRICGLPAQNPPPRRRDFPVAVV